VSISGNWMQNVAEMWLLVHLTNSGFGVGLAAGLQFLPMLLLGAMGGVVADRRDKRRLLMLTQCLMAIPAVTLWLLTAGGAVEVWMVYLLILARGTVNAFDNPARQSFVSEMVGADRVVNAVSLNSVIVHTSRIVGPALAGVTIALVGVSTCFAVNALSFAAMFIALRRMDPALLERPRRAVRERGQIRGAVREVLARPELRIPLGMMAVVGTLSFNFQVLLPLFARFTWHGTATTYALLTSAMGVGSVMGALAAGARNRTGPGLLVGSAALFGVAQLLAALAPTLEWQIVALVPLGMASVTFAAGVNSSMQLAAAPAVRGRVMALYSVVFLGSTPIGAPLVGGLAQLAGPRTGLVVGGGAALVAALGARLAYARSGVDRDLGAEADPAHELAHGGLRAAQAAVADRPADRPRGVGGVDGDPVAAAPALRDVRLAGRERQRAAAVRRARRQLDAVGHGKGPGRGRRARRADRDPVDVGAAAVVEDRE
jgi:MFS family permease